MLTTSWYSTGHPRPRRDFAPAPYFNAVEYCAEFNLEAARALATLCPQGGERMHYEPRLHIWQDRLNTTAVTLNPAEGLPAVLHYAAIIAPATTAGPRCPTIP